MIRLPSVGINMIENLASLQTCWHTELIKGRDNVSAAELAWTEVAANQQVHETRLQKGFLRFISRSDFIRALKSHTLCMRLIHFNKVIS